MGPSLTSFLDWSCGWLVMFYFLAWISLLYHIPMSEVTSSIFVKQFLLMLDVRGGEEDGEKGDGGEVWGISRKGKHKERGEVEGDVT